MKTCSKHNINRTISQNKGYQGMAFWAVDKPFRS